MISEKKIFVFLNAFKFQIVSGVEKDTTKKNLFHFLKFKVEEIVCVISGDERWIIT